MPKVRGVAGEGTRRVAEGTISRCRSYDNHAGPVGKCLTPSLPACPSRPAGRSRIVNGAANRTTGATSSTRKYESSLRQLCTRKNDLWGWGYCRGDFACESTTVKVRPTTKSARLQRRRRRLVRLVWGATGVVYHFRAGMSVNDPGRLDGKRSYFHMRPGPRGFRTFGCGRLLGGVFVLSDAGRLVALVGHFLGIGKTLFVRDTNDLEHLVLPSLEERIGSDHPSLP